jgi:predicted RNA-binding Zn-ribbon protein involved in translation (DUF1610 family)
MKLNWLLFQYTPTDLKLTRAEKRQAFARTWRNYRSTPGSLLTSFITASLLGLMWGAAPFFLFDPDFVGSFYPAILSVYPFLFVLISWPILAFAGKWIYGRAHRKALADMGYDVCIECGYWLRGLPASETRCPECGAARQRTADVRNLNPRSAAASPRNHNTHP